jgi:hypothetical protein
VSGQTDISVYPGGEKEEEKMSPTILKGKRGAIFIAVVVLVCVAALFAFPAVRSAADDVLGVFRVQKLAAVTIIPAELPPLPQLSQLNDLSALGTFVLPQELESIEVATVAEASAQVGFSVRVPQHLPPGLADSRKIGVMEETSFSYTLDLKEVQALLGDLGAQGIELPTALDGATITATIPAFVVIAHGSEDDPLILAQGKSPTLKVPDNLNVGQLRDQLLTYYAFYAPQTAAQLRAIKDWENTLVIPIPPGATHRSVMVDGSEGLLIEGIAEQITGLIWQKEGVIYGLAGKLPAEELVAIGNSLR